MDTGVFLPCSEHSETAGSMAAEASGHLVVVAIEVAWVMARATATLRPTVEAVWPFGRGLLPACVGYPLAGPTRTRRGVVVQLSGGELDGK